MTASSLFSKTNHPTRLSIIFLLAVSYFTFVHNFWQPAALFWDENYHIASAQKYLNGVFFMEPHPPLGKLLIAAGEALVHANTEDNQFIGTDYATNPPAGFSFFGYRLFPVLLAWLTTPVIFGIFFLITRKHLRAVLLSFLYVFDNALIVHSRSAMLESTMLFFSALTVLAFLLIVQHKNDRKKLMWASFLFGASFAAALATKAFALLFVLLVPFVLYALWPHLKSFWRFAWISALAFAVVYIGVWHIHFTLARTVNPTLPDAGYYQASEQYKSILAHGQNASPFAIPWMLRDSLKFVSHYEAGVPRLDLCKNDENGSPWFLWPFGGRTISYRWETPDGGAYRYLYLVSNPVGWFFGLTGVIFAFSLLAASVLYPNAVHLQRRMLITTFLTMYVSYMAAVSTIDRVMYLYHYFLPLVFSFILFGLVFDELQQLSRWKLTDARKTGVLFGLMMLVFVSFQFYRPFSYYIPLYDDQFQLRNLMQIWDMRCVKCDRNSPFVVGTN
jgi:dolichyl-phosphate-mannose-protein mannosyltransferase